ncbi:MAG: HutD family protein [Oligoflexales bacterium]
MKSRSKDIIIRTSKDFVQKPWKNGGGMTEELVAFPNAENYLWRISVASIRESGPFSLFEGFERVLIPLEGDIVLKHDGTKPVKLEVLKPYYFKGDWKTQCTLESAQAKDFNVIYRPGAVDVGIEVTTLEEEISVQKIGHRHFIYCVKGSCQFSEQEVGSHTLVEVVGDPRCTFGTRHREHPRHPERREGSHPNATIIQVTITSKT